MVYILPFFKVGSPTYLTDLDQKTKKNIGPKITTKGGKHALTLIQKDTHTK